MTMNKRFKVTALSAAIAAAGSVMPAYGYEYVQDDFRMQVDTTVSVGASWRASERDYRGVGTENALVAGKSGHLHGTSSQDNGNLYWKKGSTFSEIAKVTVDLEMNYKNYGAFVRGKAFYDHRLVNGDGVTDRPAYYPTDSNGKQLEPAQSAGSSADILDAFVWGDWWLGDKPLNVRLGKQVISWGEGVFFPNGINTINPIDVNALLAPGSELKDALIPLNSLYASIGVTDALSIEGFILFEWAETELPECGTFFSTSDIAGPNCYAGFYPGGSDGGYLATGAYPFPAAMVNLPRAADIEPDDDGQFGLAARYYAESIGTEFGLYYINYHSRLPLIGGHMPNPAELGYADNLVAARGQVLTAFGNPFATAVLFPSADLVIEYPEDIQLLGASFSTTLDMGLPGGATSVSGEISMRKDQPFQMEDGTTIAGLLGLPANGCYDAPTPYDCYSKYEPGDYVEGFIESDYYQAEIAFIHFFDRILGASRWTTILDLAGSYTDLPSKDEAVLNGAYNATLNHPWAPNVATIAGIIPTPYPLFLDAAAAATDSAAPEDDYYPTSGAWGYKMRFTGEYNNVFAGVNLRPTISFSHDVSGTTPGPISNFIENRKALGLSVEAEYEHAYTMKLAYTDFYGAEPYNQLADRDFYSISASASF